VLTEISQDAELAAVKIAAPPSSGNRWLHLTGQIYD
jgi:hypothetical protein